MLFEGNKKKLFDDAYTEYLKIAGYLKTMSIMNDGLVAGDENLQVELDLYLQRFLFDIAIADKIISEDEILFIKSLPDNEDDICRQVPGYRRLLRKPTLETYQEKRNEIFDPDKSMSFLECIKDAAESDNDILEVINAIEVIGNCFVAIDDNVSEQESEIVSREIEILKRKYLKTEKNKKLVSGEVADEASSLPNLMSELDNLIGLENVKKEVRATINLLKVNEMRKEKGLPELQTSKHMVFTGQPGTGKTTVARILAQIYKSIGVVSKGQLVETDRSGLVAGYVGQTALKVAQVVRKAKGGILFIDEAYSLSASDSPNDFGKEAIDTLVKAMEDNRDDLIVIVAGYSNEMENFINANPGLRSRFNKYINFDNYSAAEMMEIFKMLCEQSKYILDNAAQEKTLQFFEKNAGDEQFGNARGVRNFFDRTITQQASRIVEIENVGDEEFRTICGEDVVM